MDALGDQRIKQRMSRRSTHEATPSSRIGFGRIDPMKGGIQRHCADVHEPVVIATEHICDLAEKRAANSPI
jgi:hypothetical protein